MPERLLCLVLLTMGGGLLSGCVSDTMWNGSRLKPLAQSPSYPGGSPVFANQGSSRPLVPDTVARGQAHTDLPLYEGREQAPGRPLVTTFPFPITRKVLDRGQERFNIYCSPCHGRTGEGNGMIVQRGFPSPPSYYLPRLRQAPVGHFFDVITNGYGVMYSFNDRVKPEDRWAIAAYIRVLQATRPVATVGASPSNAARPRIGGTP
jgi:cytochrome c553